MQTMCIWQLYAKVLEPLTQAILLSASRLDVVSAGVYILNSLHAVRQLLAMLEYARERTEILDAQVYTKDFQ